MSSPDDARPLEGLSIIVPLVEHLEASSPSLAGGITRSRPEIYGFLEAPFDRRRAEDWLALDANDPGERETALRAIEGDLSYSLLADEQRSNPITAFEDLLSRGGRRPFIYTRHATSIFVGWGPDTPEGVDLVCEPRSETLRIAVELAGSCTREDGSSLPVWTVPLTRAALLRATLCVARTDAVAPLFRQLIDVSPGDAADVLETGLRPQRDRVDGRRVRRIDTLLSREDLVGLLGSEDPEIRAAALVALGDERPARGRS